MLIYKNIKKPGLPVFHIASTIFSIFLLNYISITGVGQSNNILLFVIVQIALYLLSPICAFVFCFVMNINLMQNSNPLWMQPLTVVFSCSIFIFNPKLIKPLLNNKKFKTVFYFSLMYSFFIIYINLLSKTDVNAKVIFEHFNILFGFLIFVPAYYFTVRQPENLFKCFASIAFCFLVVYYINLIFNLNLFKIGEINASIETQLTRFAGYDLRQFIVFFIFLIPAFLLTKAVSIITKYLIISIGFGALLVLILGIYRLAMFYNFMGLLLSLYFIGKYVKTGQLLKRFIFIAIFVSFSVSFFSEYITEFQKVFSGTLDYFNGKGDDVSADERFLNQAPILLAYIYTDFWTGCGIVEAALMTKKEMYGFVDIPLLGSLAKFGFLAMFFYYFRFYYILRNKNQFNIKYLSLYNENQKLFLYVYLTVKAYIISLITFRLFYISWELAFDWQQLEFGLLVGIYIGLERVIMQNENIIFHQLKIKNE